MNKMQAEQFFYYKNFATKGKSLKVENSEFHRISEKYIRNILTILMKKYKLSNRQNDFSDSELKPLLKAGYMAVFKTALSLIEYKRVENQSPSDIWQLCFLFLNRSGLGKFQLIETSEKKSTARSYGSVEDRLYVELFGKSEFPVSAFTSGMIMACHNISHNAVTILNQTKADEDVAKTDLFKYSIVKQSRCEAEDLSFSEFNVTTNQP